MKALQHPPGREVLHPQTSILSDLFARTMVETPKSPNRQNTENMGSFLDSISCAFLPFISHSLVVYESFISRSVVILCQHRFFTFFYQLLRTERVICIARLVFPHIVKVLTCYSLSERESTFSRPQPAPQPPTTVSDYPQPRTSATRPGARVSRRTDDFV